MSCPLFQFVDTGTPDYNDMTSYLLRTCTTSYYDEKFKLGTDNLLTYGSDDLTHEENINIFKHVFNLIKSSERFHVV